MNKEKKVPMNIVVNKNIRVAVEAIAEESHMSISEVAQHLLFEGLSSYYKLATKMNEMEGD